MRRCRSFYWIPLVILSTAGPATAGPPFFTDDPEPVDRHHWEVYMASQYLRLDDNRFGTAPHLEINYGAYPDLQLHVIAPAAFSRGPGGPTLYGYGDTELGAKYRFLKETSTRPQIGTFVLVEAPTGNADRGLGNGAAQVFVPIWIQKSFGSWTSYGGGGYWINTAADQSNGGFVGWLLQRNLSTVVTLGAELFRRQGESPNGPAGTGFTVGGQVNLGDHYHVLFSAGRDLTGPERLTHYVALQGTF